MHRKRRLIGVDIAIIENTKTNHKDVNIQCVYDLYDLMGLIDVCI